MVNNCRHTFLVMWIAIIHVALSLSANAQSKHAALWYIGGYCFDFATSPATITKVEGGAKNAIWYVDGNGKHALTYSNEKLYDGNMEEIALLDGFGNGFFVPNSSNEDLVYFVSTDNYYTINLKEKTVIDNEEPINMNRSYHIAVHHAECDKIWLINANGMTWHEYQLSSHGIEKVRDIPLNPENYKYTFSNATSFETNLSADCKHYTMCNQSQNYSEVYYGDFDRETGLFTRVARHDLGNNITYIYNTMVAPDNSRIYYIVRTSDRKFQILEVPIIDNIPQFDKQQVAMEKRAGINAYCPMSYGIDGKIYIIETPNRLCSTLSIDNGTTVYEEIYDFGGTLAGHYNYMLASWFMDLPCTDTPPAAPCAAAAIPDIHFDNPFVCHGESLNAIIPDGNVQSFTYTHNGEDFTVGNLSAQSYQLPDDQGVYQITKITDNDGCEFVPTQPISAEIGAEIPKPTIKWSE